jgi:hypothetical protein
VLIRFNTTLEESGRVPDSFLAAWKTTPSVGAGSNTPSTPTLRPATPPAPSRCITFAEGSPLTEAEARKRLQGGD